MTKKEVAKELLKLKKVANKCDQICIVFWEDWITISTYCVNECGVKCCNDDREYIFYHEMPDDLLGSLLRLPGESDTLYLWV